MRRLFPLGAALALLSAAPASAQVTITLGGSAKACFEAAKEMKKDLDSERLCSMAIDYQMLNQRDLAGTYANRGAIKFNRGDFDAAQQDFELAIRTEPGLSESHINRGAALQRMGLYSEAVDEINQGLALNPEDPARAYFNRGVVRQNQRDLTGAYQDFRKAAELAPNWEEPKLMADQFVVQPKGAKPN